MSEKKANRRGGARPGAGRKPCTGPYGEPTRAIRVPVSALPVLKAWLAAKGKAPPARSCLPAPAPAGHHLPLYGSKVPAGFPSPADDHQEDGLDLNQHLVKHPAATFFVRVEGDSMTGAGIHHGDLLVVDRALEPKSGSIVVAAVNGELTVKRLKVEGERLWLMPEHPDFKPLEIGEGMEFLIWGVVAHAVRSF
ncbi:LexA family protein [Methylohalobius crimeensis]|uniref:LexA family protein n=1 Tax=Methylohalobius crimeensis TaxID=244365 RepID=UPI0003B70594|nr:translesion error-prone DNA polymerase V autoproteolytic subunit [Methylohalobius crimeensis]